MNKNDLIGTVAEASGLTRIQASQAVEGVFDAITGALRKGDEVRLVDTPISQGEPPADTPKTFTATVFSIREDAQNSRWIVDLVVSPQVAPDIAARAATGRVALVLDSGE